MCAQLSGFERDQLSAHQHHLNWGFLHINYNVVGTFPHPLTKYHQWPEEKSLRIDSTWGICQTHFASARSSGGGGCVSVADRALIVSRADKVYWQVMEREGKVVAGALFIRAIHPPCARPILTRVCTATSEVCAPPCFNHQQTVCTRAMHQHRTQV